MAVLNTSSKTFVINVAIKNGEKIAINFVKKSQIKN